MKIKQLFAITHVIPFLLVLGIASLNLLTNAFSATASLRSQNRQSPLALSSSDLDDSVTEGTSTSVNFAMEPASKEALAIVRDNFGMTLEQHQQLASLAVLVVDWNSKINLISRKDCSKEVVFGRHILPSLAFLGLPSEDEGDFSIPREADQGLKIIDVGTGGGFPGLPLAIAYPHCDFLLVDSVGKKLTAVQDMADRLGLTNVKTHHGRAEVLDGTYDVCVGRSVAAIPTYCFWIQSLLKKNTGRLMYLIGGDIEENLLEQTIWNQDIDDLLQCPGASDKKILVFPQNVVKKIAAASGEKVRVPKPKAGRTMGNKKKTKAKGEWGRRDNSAPKQRGYENFQRYDNLNPNSD